MSVQDERIKVTVDGSIAYVTMSRPDRHNGMDFPMLAAMIAAQKKVRRLRNIRAVILHGEGPSFCAGLDFKTVLGQPVKAFSMYTQVWWPFRNDFQTWSMGWRKVGVPVIAVIHGNCFGAGIQLALGADFRFTTPDARISILEAKWGLIPDMGGATLLRELVPIDVAKELTMTGRIISGEDAKTLNLVTHVADNPLAAARVLAEEIATRSPDSVAAGKFLFQKSYDTSEYGALRAERLWQRRLMGYINNRIAIQRNQKQSDTPFAPRRLGR